MTYKFMLAIGILFCINCTAQAVNWAVMTAWLDSNCNTDSYFDPSGITNIRLAPLDVCRKSGTVYVKFTSTSSKVTQQVYSDSSCSDSKTVGNPVEFTNDCKAFGQKFTGTNQGKVFSDAPVYHKAELYNVKDSPVTVGNAAGSPLTAAVMFYTDKECTELGQAAKDKWGNARAFSEGFNSNMFGKCHKDWYHMKAHGFAYDMSWKITGSSSDCLTVKHYNDVTCSTEASSTKLPTDGSCYEFSSGQWARAWYRKGSKAPSQCTNPCTENSCGSGQFCGDISKKCKDKTCANYRAEECPTGTFSCAISGGSTSKSCVKNTNTGSGGGGSGGGGDSDGACCETECGSLGKVCQAACTSGATACQCTESCTGKGNGANSCQKTVTPGMCYGKKNAGKGCCVDTCGGLDNICTASCQGTTTGIQEACTCRKSADNCNTVSSSDKSISCTVQTTGCVAVSSASTTVQNILTIVATFFIILFLA